MNADSRTDQDRGFEVAARTAAYVTVAAFLYGVTRFPGSAAVLTYVAPALVLVAPLLGIVCLVRSRGDTGAVSLSARRTFIFTLVRAAGVGVALLFLVSTLKKLTF
jgi:hypothetical protein